MNLKKILILSVITVLAVGSAFAGLTKSQKSEITFKGFGKMTSTTTETLAGNRKLTDTDADFEGKGLLGGLAGKTMMPSGHTGEFVDLAAMTTAQINHKKKTYTVTPIEKWAETQKEAQNAGKTEETGTEKKESPIRIVKTDFTVTDTGETKTINGFNCRKFVALWTVDWENTENGEKGTDKLETATWTTPMTADLQAAQAEEMAYAQAYMKAVGLNMQDFQKDVLGTQWISMLAAFDPVNGQSRTTPDPDKVAAEMRKVQGYPIVIDGKYFVTPKFKKAEEEPSTGGGLAGRLVGGLFKKKANPEEANAPTLAFYTETTAVKVMDIDPASLQIPADCKKK
jgi:hypothetical protein